MIIKLLVAVTDYQKEEHSTFTLFPKEISAYLYIYNRRKACCIIKNSCHSTVYLKATSVSTTAVSQREFKGDAQDPKVNQWHSYERKQLTYLLQGHPSPFLSMLSVPMLILNYKQKCMTQVVVTLLTLGPV